MINDNQSFFGEFSKGQQITGTMLVTLYEKFKKSNDLHFEEYGACESMGVTIGEQFISIWKDTGNSSVEYKGKYKASFVLVDIIEDIEVYECIYLI